MGRLLLIIFLLIQFFSLTRDFFLHYLGQGLMPLFTYSSYGALFLLPFLLFFYSGKEGYLKNFTASGIYLVLLITLAFTWTSLYGLVSGYLISDWILDFTTFAAFISFLVLGTKERFWTDFYTPAFTLFVIAVVLNIVATTIIVMPNADLVDFAKNEDRFARTILSYQTQWSLSFWPLFLLIAPIIDKKYYPVIIFSVIFVLLQQILFQKRGPTMRILFYLGIYFFVFSRLLKRRKLYKVSIVKRVWLVVFLGIALAIGSTIIPVKLVTNQVSGLVKRFSGETGITKSGQKKVVYEAGFWGIFSTDNERLKEVSLMLGDLSPLQVLIGKGAGGSYKDPTGLYANWNRDRGGFYKSTTHIGIFTIVLKGGLLLLLIYMLCIFYALIQYKYHFRDVVSGACFFIVIIWTLFHFAEGWFLFSGAAFDCILFSMALGRLMTNKKRILRLQQAIT